MQLRQTLGGGVAPEIAMHLHDFFLRSYDLSNSFESQNNITPGTYWTYIIGFWFVFLAFALLNDLVAPKLCSTATNA